MRLGLVRIRIVSWCDKNCFPKTSDCVKSALYANMKLLNLIPKETAGSSCEEIAAPTVIQW